MAALLAARLYRFVCDALEVQLDYVCWSDSSIVLHWITGSATKWKPFVANRVKEINKLTGKDRWRHCAGDDNPADLLTRGIAAHQLKNPDLWWKGPGWLSTPEAWPQAVHAKLAHHNDEALEALCVEAQVSLVISPEHFSGATRLIRVTAWILRYIRNLRCPQGRQRGPLSADELKQAERYWISSTQVKFLPPTSPILDNFRCFRDDDGILRLQGRLQLSEQSTAVRHTILLPPASEAWFTRLVILREHARMSHAGVQETLHQLREEFWIVTGRQSVKFVLHHCYRCRRLKTRACTEEEAPLPKARVTQQFPFEVVGVDFGHFTIRSPAALIGSLTSRYSHARLPGQYTWSW
ncbi:uncharacterized protein LOC135384326 [Ornithodoros turicata]|uniref:uncharacterized protein LOC135384326 n=1 Tax=Ornithodoros turicata TaxID=34597 RepID=UPI00313996B3